jgi:predicted enzyme related to lactoylglutathione lyase
MRTVIYPVKELARAKELYGALLGVAPSMDKAYYVGFSIEGQEVGLDPHGHSQGMTGLVGYWHVDDINERLERLLAAGAEVQHAVRDVGGGKLIATVKDVDGNLMGSFSHRDACRRDDTQCPWAHHVLHRCGPQIMPIRAARKWMHTLDAHPRAAVGGGLG